jgi:hypothetical protein
MLTNTSGILLDTSDIEIIPTFNATSKLNFRCYKVRRKDSEEDAHTMRLYRSLRNRKLIYADGIGFFVITSVVDGYADHIAYKDIAAESCEVELRTKDLPYIENGTYKFYTGEAGNPGMIERLMAYAPLWTLGNIDITVVNRYRTFEDVDFSKNILGFMLEDLQDAYECLFVFDIVNRVVNIYDKANYVHETDIHLTKDDLMTSINITESSDDLYTALRVTGDEELSINAVNPLGTGVIYNFNYYLDWMTDTLGEKVRTWQALVNSYKDSYYNLQLSRYANLTTKSGIDAELDRLNTQLTMYTRCRENIVAEASDEDIAAYNAVIVQVGGVPIPENQGYLWVMYADDSHGTNITANPYGKRYIGLAYDKSTQVASNNPSDYSWYTFRNGETFPRTVDGQTKYTWIVFADSIVSGMSNDPDEKAYIGVALDKSSATKSTDYKDYSWSLIESGGIGLNETLATILSLIEDTETEIAAAQAQKTALEAIIADQDSQVSAIHNAVAMDSYFTDEDMDELSNYIVEGTYTDEYVTVTESMTYSERFEQMKTLYDRSVDQLERIAYPTQEFSLDVENFIFIKEFERWSEQLETGCLINVEVDDNDVAALFLTSFEVNYEDKKLTMTFGNRYNRFDSKALFDKVLGSVSRTANTLAYVKNTIYPIESGEFNKMKEALETSRTLTKNAVLSSTNEQVIIDDTGYTGRRKLPDGTIDPKQIKINGRNIVFTDDAWETCKTAIGEIILSGGASAYGINAEVLLGNIIMGNELHILNADGEDMFEVTEDNIMLRVGEEYAAKEDTISGVDVMYCRANSSSVCDASTITVAWSTVAPAWVSGEYIWQKTVTTFDDGNSSESAPTCITGAAGQDGRPGANGYVHTAWANSADGQTDFSTSVSANKKYLGVYTDNNATASQTYSDYNWSLIKGADGTDGDDGVGVLSASVTYVVSNNGSTPPESGWSDSFPGTITEGQYLWTRTVTTYTDDTVTVSYSVSANGVGISSIIDEYYLSSSNSQQTDGEWATSPPVWSSGKYIWTRSHIYWDNNTDTTTTPVLNETYNHIGASLDNCVTEININKAGIEQNTQYYQELYGQVAKINAYIQTGVVSVDEDGKTSFGVKIGENLSSIDAYIVSGATAFSAGWLSDTVGGAAITPVEDVLYQVKNTGAYYNKTYRWNGTAYTEAGSEGTLSSVFTSSELGFYDTGEKTAYFSNKNLNVRTVRTGKILLSPDVISDTSTNNWQIGIDNGFYIKWIGA